MNLRHMCLILFGFRLSPKEIIFLLLTVCGQSRLRQLRKARQCLHMVYNTHLHLVGAMKSDMCEIKNYFSHVFPISSPSLVAGKSTCGEHAALCGICDSCIYLAI